MIKYYIAGLLDTVYLVSYAVSMFARKKDISTFE